MCHPSVQYGFNRYRMVRPKTKEYTENTRTVKIVRRRFERKKKSNLQDDIDTPNRNMYISSSHRLKLNLKKQDVLKSNEDIKQLYNTCK